jgi:predicted O-linked N-acetylglucosamine transferase (SPINDLY family)/GT2 family glycosyltransferase
MDTTADVGDPLDRAWRCFHAGQREQALHLAMEAFANAQSPQAAAALGHFLTEAGLLVAAEDVLVPASASAPEHAPLHWHLGLLRVRQGQPGMAASSLRMAALLSDPLHEAAFTLAWVLDALNELPEALAWAEQALAAERLPTRLVQVGWFRQKLGQFKPALALYEEAIAAFDDHAPEQAQLHLHHAQCLAALQQTARAADSLAAGLARWPDSPELLTALVEWECQHGHLHRAIAVARRQVDTYPDSAAAWHLLGRLQQEAGDLLAADASFNEVQQRDMTRWDALLRRAQIQVQWQHPVDAEWLLLQVLAHQPDWPPALDLMARVQLDLGRLDDARRQLLKRLRIAPERVDTWLVLAQTHARRRRLPLARRALARALRLDPADTDALRLLGWTAKDQGDLATAINAVRHLLQQRPDDPAAQVQAAFIFAAANDLAVAARHAQAAVAVDPKNAHAWRALAQVRYQQQRLDEAQAAIETALQWAPDLVEALRQLGWILLAGHRFGAARLAFLHACEREPDNPVPWRELVETCLRAGEFAEGLQVTQRLLHLGGDDAAARLLHARLLTEGAGNGYPQAIALCRALIVQHQHTAEAVRVLVRLHALGGTGAHAALSLVSHADRQAALRDAIAHGAAFQGHGPLQSLTRTAAQDFPQDGWLATAELYARSLSDTATAATLADAARDWYRGLKLRAGMAPWQRPDLPRRAGARPRIAYIAGQLHERFLGRVLASHDPQAADVFLFAHRPMPGLPSHIHQEALVPNELARACAANGIDVVIDAGGLHPFEGQFDVLQAFARRLAPLQVGWLGCWGTAGGLFDVLLTDAVAVPATHEQHLEEALWRLDGGQWCWEPPTHAPTPQPSPARRAGRVTFGVIARGLRLNGASLDAWARTVAATPHAQIRFIGQVASDWPQREQVLAAMAAQGVAAARVAFDPPRSYEELLHWFQQIDLVLDSFPGNGGLSLLDPLWMGVPVVTLSGDWPGARQGHAILAALGLQAWVADTPTRYVDTAVALAGDSAALAAHRAGLRARLLASPLTDGRRVARQIEQACRQFVAGAAPAETDADPKQRIRAQARRALLAWLEKPACINLPEVAPDAVPDLSVIVILYNQAGLTRRTLQALADQRGASFETILIDNASSDETAALLARVSGARTVFNADNAGFLLAANQAAAMARGRHLVFLNSDAIVQRDALAATCHALDADPSIGALGGRIVLTAGGLQEAGNVIFRDGTALGVGRGEDPFCPAAMTRHTTDYVSGVFLAVPASLWRMLGGFDEAFAPAYYEDTDFCLRVWRAGFRVVVDADVLVEHVEWGSAVANEATQRMRDHRTRFVARYADWLQGQPHPRAQPLDGDRWRTPEDHPRRARVLVIDNEVPHMVKGGGLPRARLMLQALRDWPVTFFPLWQLDDDWRDVYASLPSSVEVMLGHGLPRLEAFLERRRGLYDVLLVSRPPNLQALQPLRARRPELFADMRLVYDAEALFALREIAEAGVHGRPLDRAAARARLTREIGLARGASDVLVVSQRDAACFRAAGHRVTVLSHGIAVRRSAPGLAQRSGLLFVGALHPDTPNEDGLVWFIEQVMPLLRAQLPQPPVLSVVGINRSARVAALTGDDVQVLGPCDALEPLYDAARVFVAPVRYAGGVPAKVIEAAAQGIPVVASALLVRQLDWREGIDIQAARGATAFAQGIVRLLRDDSLWQRQQQAAWQQCAERYEPQRFAQRLQQVLDTPPEAGA